jgi:hypothetical protein
MWLTFAAQGALCNARIRGSRSRKLLVSTQIQCATFDNLTPFHASHSQETCPGRKTQNRGTYAGRNTNDKETRARRETESATTLGFTAT